MSKQIIIQSLVWLCLSASSAQAFGAALGEEKAVPSHLADGDEFTVKPKNLIKHGELLFNAVWTNQDGGGRPLTKGTGAPLSDMGSPLTFPRNFNRVSAPDSNSCSGCHNKPFPGGGGDIVANVFVTGQRFDFASFDPLDLLNTRGTFDETGNATTLQTIANSRNTLGMFGSGYIEMLSRQMTADLQLIRDGLAVGGSADLVSKGIHFGKLSRDGGGAWITTAVEGLPSTSTSSADAAHPPSLIIRPFHQAGAVVSLREFTNNAFNHHHGIQSTERFGVDTDQDGDNVKNELTRADVTAVTVWQAQLPVPGRVIPKNKEVEQAILLGEKKFADIGCTDCHVPSLPLTGTGNIFVEPNPYNPSGNLQTGQADDFSIDLNSRRLDRPRLKAETTGANKGNTLVPAYTDLKLHDITTGPTDPNREPINQLAEKGSTEFFSGNSQFLTRKLWGVANEPPYFHHGQYTTLREAVEAHHGESQTSYNAWTELSADEKNAVIEFLKSLQVLPAGSKTLVVDEKGKPRKLPTAN